MSPSSCQLGRRRLWTAVAGCEENCRDGEVGRASSEVRRGGLDDRLYVIQRARRQLVPVRLEYTRAARPTSARLISAIKGFIFSTEDEWSTDEPTDGRTDGREVAGILQLATVVGRQSHTSQPTMKPRQQNSCEPVIQTNRGGDRRTE